MRYFLFVFLFCLFACAHSVEIEDIKQYKCGDKVIQVTFLDDDSVIITANGDNTVLNRTAADKGERYDNSDLKMSFFKIGRSVYLSVDGVDYPVCYEIKR